MESPDSNQCSSGSFSPVEMPSSVTEAELRELTELDDVAVIGMACRVAGGNHSPEQLWESILAKRVASSEIPPMRWEPYRHRDVRNIKALDNTTSRGYYLDALEDFDPYFFGISPKEAEQMDPQQRVSLEVAWEALEHAGIDPKELSGSDTSVFMGVNSDDYGKLLLEDLPNIEPWLGIGTAYCGIPNRISYQLNLMGPSTAVDAACASSLVAIHHGRQAILCGESKIAITGGVNALCGPGLTRVLDKAGAISPDGSCLSFDDNAHGYGRGEGAAVVVLKRLRDAIKDGDNIIALLKGSAVAQDGKTNGIMAPNAKAQELVARQALKQANIDPATVEYVEAHATSTPLGDPTEVSAISAVYGVSRSKPVNIGSVKPNVGHLEAGAGAIGFVKAVLALNKTQFPPQANLTKLNSKVDWENSGTQVVQEVSDWLEVEAHPRRAAICSYGYGGTVSHAIIEQSSFRLATMNQQYSESAHVPVTLAVSAPQRRRLDGQAGLLARWLMGPGKGEDLRSIANTLALHRAHHEYRAAFAVTSVEQAAKVLKTFAEGGNNGEWVSQGNALAPSTKKDVVWVFSGHGAQWNEMARQLVDNPVFHSAVEPLDRIVQAEAGFSPIMAFRKSGNDYDQSDRVQILTYVFQMGLVALLRSEGVSPGAIIGHSVGEIAASVTAGCLTSEEGALVVTRRAGQYAKVKGLGAMFLVNLPFDQVKTELYHEQDVVAAIHSSPSACVISGRVKATEIYVEKLKERGIEAMRVTTDIAFHSAGMLSPLAQPVREILAKYIQPRPATIPLYSTSDVDPRSDTLRDAEYWVHNMISPVLLTSAVKASISDGFRLFLEVSSNPIVSHSIHETIIDDGIENEEFAVIPTVRRHKCPETCVAQAIGRLYTKAATIDFNRSLGRRWAPGVPGTQWVHKPIWRKVHSGRSLGSGSLAHDVDKHTLLGQLTPVSGTAAKTTLYTTRLTNDTKPFPGDHPLHGTEIVPAAVLINTFHHATGASTLSNIVLHVPVAISGARDVQVVLVDDSIKITSRLQQSSTSEEQSWVTHTVGRWSVTQSNTSVAPYINIEAVKRRIGTVLPSNFSIDYLHKVGVSAMGFPWAVTEHFGDLKQMLAHVDVAPDVAEGTELPWHGSSWAPILDAATSVGSTIFFDRPKLRMPAQIETVQFFTEYGVPPPKTCYLYVEEACEHGAPAIHVNVCNREGRVLARFESMRFSEIEGTPGVGGSVESLVHHIAWVPALFSRKAASWDSFILVSEDPATLDWRWKQLQKERRARNVTATRVQSAAEVVAESLATNTAIIYCPGPVSVLADVPSKAETFLSELLILTKHAVGSTSTSASGSGSKVFAITTAVSTAETPTSLSHAPLHGLARIIASEHPDQWGALIDDEDLSGNRTFPMLAMTYVHGQDVICMDDGLPCVARLQPLPRERLYDPLTSSSSSPPPSLLPKAAGTYLVTGGLGSLGLEVAGWLVEKGARRMVLVSRRTLPARCEWDKLETSSSSGLRPAVDKILALEACGATVYTLAVDVGAADAAAVLKTELDRLGLPPVLGVVHAAGTLEDQLILNASSEAFSRVLQPKVAGALALHTVFPPQTLDWLVLFSSCGQLFGFPGQGSYASGNAFLDSLATYRRTLGDNTVAFQWTSWRGLGMAASTGSINAELHSKGISDVTPEEAFRAWEHFGKFDLAHGAVLRSLAFPEGKPLPVDILDDIAIRTIAPSSGAAEGDINSDTAGGGGIPTNDLDLRTWLEQKIRDIFAGVLMLRSADEVDPRAAIAQLGVDSVITVTLRHQLQSVLKVKVPPTLFWSHPTVRHLTSWFAEKIEK
ncbi:6-methylsalicylic acid synthase [Alternaria rosae]|uniref:6-methylsalicylic acid synthase n=1 Tax=Alternaria rosae TaxID=1187941 RepID=UPI001E8D658D|nr:6-methylsalicylic acid synthase [Alternaria rosae]KAH6866466.1 6-methylsalicylic acid synthase [Alternaria rosae]